MPGSGWLPIALVAVLALVLTVTFEVVVRRRAPRHGPVDPSPVPGSRLKMVATMICAAMGVVGAVWLLPWAVILSSTGASVLLPGVLAVTVLCVAALYAVQSLDPHD